jgi:hypothetical protein
MKIKILLLLLIPIFFILTCNIKYPEQKIEFINTDIYNGHTYLIMRTEWAYTTTIIHDPNCPKCKEISK